MRTKCYNSVVGFLAGISLAVPAVGQSTNSTKLKEPVAIVAGEAVYEVELSPLIQSQLLQVRQQEYELKRRALEQLVNQRLLETEAKKKGIPAEKLLALEVDGKVAAPTEPELEAFYLAQKDRLNRPFDEVKTALQQGLKQAKIQQARQSYLRRLRGEAEVVVFLRPPKAEITYDLARLRGRPNAPVVVVEFSDFGCPFCRNVQSSLKDLLDKYHGKVSLAYRDFPLKELHPQAQLAATASRCAGEQGKFWEYHDLLFANADKLTRDGLLENAPSLKLDEDRSIPV